MSDPTKSGRGRKKRQKRNLADAGEDERPPPIAAAYSTRQKKAGERLKRKDPPERLAVGPAADEAPRSRYPQRHSSAKATADGDVEDEKPAAKEADGAYEPHADDGDYEEDREPASRIKEDSKPAARQTSRRSLDMLSEQYTVDTLGVMDYLRSSSVGIGDKLVEDLDLDKDVICHIAQKKEKGTRVNPNDGFYQKMIREAADAMTTTDDYGPSGLMTAAYSIVMEVRKARSGRFLSTARQTGVESYIEIGDELAAWCVARDLDRARGQAKQRAETRGPMSPTDELTASSRKTQPPAADERGNLIYETELDLEGKPTPSRNPGKTTGDSNSEGWSPMKLGESPAPDEKDVEEEDFSGLREELERMRILEAGPNETVPAIASLTAPDAEGGGDAEAMMVQSKATAFGSIMDKWIDCGEDERQSGDLIEEVLSKNLGREGRSVTEKILRGLPTSRSANAVSERIESLLSAIGPTSGSDALWEEHKISKMSQIPKKQRGSNKSQIVQLSKKQQRYGYGSGTYSCAICITEKPKYGTITSTACPEGAKETWTDLCCSCDPTKPMCDNCCFDHLTDEWNRKHSVQCENPDHMMEFCGSQSSPMCLLHAGPRKAKLSYQCIQCPGEQFCKHCFYNHHYVDKFPLAESEGKSEE